MCFSLVYFQKWNFRVDDSNSIAISLIHNRRMWTLLCCVCLLSYRDVFFLLLQCCCNTFIFSFAGSNAFEKKVIKILVKGKMRIFNIKISLKFYLKYFLIFIDVHRCWRNLLNFKYKKVVKFLLLLKFWFLIKKN